MKANRKFVEADEAVSPVIAVILMVAITVVLAATVFVLVSDIGSNTQQQGPQMGWTTDESADTFSVSQAPNQVLWKDFEVKMSPSTATVEYVLDAGPAGVATNVAASYSAIDNDGDETATDSAFDEQVKGGDTLSFCGGAGGAGTEETDVTITIRHAPSNSVAKEFKFSTIAACA
jgi:flagellin-like protein